MPWPRELVALAVAGVVLTSRSFHSRDMLGLVDRQLLILFVGLFVVRGAVDFLGAAGVDATHPGWLSALSVGLSNTLLLAAASPRILP